MGLQGQVQLGSPLKSYDSSVTTTSSMLVYASGGMSRLPRMGTVSKEIKGGPGKTHGLHQVEEVLLLMTR